MRTKGEGEEEEEEESGEREMRRGEDRERGEEPRT